MSSLLLMANPRKKRTKARRRRRVRVTPVVEPVVETVVTPPPRVRRVRRRRRSGRGRRRMFDTRFYRQAYGNPSSLMRMLEQALPLGGGFAAGLYLPKVIFGNKDRTPTAYLANIGIGMVIPMLTRLILPAKMSTPIGVGYISAQLVKLFDDLMFRNNERFKALREGDEVQLLDYSGDDVEVVSAGEDEMVVDAGPEDYVVEEDDSDIV